MKYLILIAIVFFIFVGDFRVSLTSQEYKYEIEYNGLLWVALDWYSIMENNSQDEPMILFKYTKTKKT